MEDVLREICAICGNDDVPPLYYCDVCDCCKRCCNWKNHEPEINYDDLKP
jgi:hypothetical protein